MRVNVYHGNQKHQANKLKAKQEAAAATAPSDSDLTEYESAVDSPQTLIMKIKFREEESKDKLRNILAQDEFNLRKRKASLADSPVDSSIKRSKHDEELSSAPTWATANHTEETIRVAHPQRPVFAPEHHAEDVTAISNSFVAVNSRRESQEQGNQHQYQHQQMPAPEVSDTDDDVSAFGRAELSAHSSSDGGDQNLPETPGDGVLTSGMQYTLDIPTRGQTHEAQTPVAQDEQLKTQRPLDAFPLDPLGQLLSGKIPKSRRRAKKSKTSMRPMMNEGPVLSEESDGHPEEFQPRDSQSLPSRPPIMKQSPVFCEQAPPIHEATIYDAAGNAHTRTLVRRTHCHASGKPEANTSSDKPEVNTNSNQQLHQLTPLSTRTSVANAPFEQRVQITPLSATQALRQAHHQPHHQPHRLSGSPADTLAGALNPQHTPVASPLPSRQSITTTMPSPSTDMPASGATNLFINFRLQLNGRSRQKVLDLTACSDVYKLHETVAARLKHALQGQTPSEIVFTINKDDEYAIEADEAGQITWRNFLQKLPGAEVVEAEVVV